VGWPNPPLRALRTRVEAAEAFQGDVVAEQVLGDQRMPVPRPRYPNAEHDRHHRGDVAGGRGVSWHRTPRPASLKLCANWAEEAEYRLRRWTGAIRRTDSDSGLSLKLA
jgi:hypothetical protein